MTPEIKFSGSAYKEITVQAIGNVFVDTKEKIGEPDVVTIFLKRLAAEGTDQVDECKQAIGMVSVPADPSFLVNISSGQGERIFLNGKEMKVIELRAATKDLMTVKEL